jgi:hypothetical protein
MFEPNADGELRQDTDKCCAQQSTKEGKTKPIIFSCLRESAI